MEFENEQKHEEQSAEQQSTNNQENGYQGYRPGRSPRPRINQPRPQFGQQGGYHRNQNQDEGGFRPEGFGAGLQSAPQHGGYRPRNNYNQEGGYQQGGYRPRAQYGQQGGYRPRYNQQGDGEQGGYRPRQQ